MLEIKKRFLNLQNEENAKNMKAYMKNNFEFLGIRTAERRKVQKEEFKKIPKDAEIDKEFVRNLWNEEFREFQYAALDYLIKMRKKLKKDDILFIEELIRNKPWWDTIDPISSYLVGEICKNYPEVIDTYIIKWIEDENFWIRRSSIIFQLKYKEKTNTNILEKSIKFNINEKEFFIRKAIGWALREYSKTNKNWVSDFVKNNDMSGLSKREASKYLD